MSGFMELCQRRYSVRRFDYRPVEEEKLRLILEAGRLAPTGYNYQPQRIYVIKSEEARGRLAKLTPMTFGAPVVLLVCWDENVSWKNTPDTYGDNYDCGEMDAVIVGVQMMDMATELGLGTLWARGFCARSVHDEFGLPENEKVAFFLDVGYISERSVRHERPRKPLGETVREL